MNTERVAKNAAMMAGGATLGLLTFLFFPYPITAVIGYGLGMMLTDAIMGLPGPRNF